MDKINRAHELAASGNYRAALNLLREPAAQDVSPYNARLALAGIYREIGCPDQAGRWGIVADGWATETERDRLARLLAASGVTEKSARAFLRIPHNAEDPTDLAAVVARVPNYRARGLRRYDWDPFVVPGGSLAHAMSTAAKWLFSFAVASLVIAMIAVWQITLAGGHDARNWTINGSLIFAAFAAASSAAIGVSRLLRHRIWSGIGMVGLGIVAVALGVGLLSA